MHRCPRQDFTSAGNTEVSELQKGAYSPRRDSHPALFFRIDRAHVTTFRSGRVMLSLPSSLSVRRRRPMGLTSVRRSNPACRFPTLGFHKGVLIAMCKRRDQSHKVDQRQLTIQRSLQQRLPATAPPPLSSAHSNGLASLPCMPPVR